MAKRGKTEGVLARETRLKAEASAIAAAEKAKADAEKAVADAKAEAERKRAIEQAPKAPRPKKVKKPRFIREQTEKRPAPKPKPAALPERSTKFRAKLMTKNLAEAPKDETLSAPLPKGPNRQ
jgi:hypothetical protein